MRKYRQVCPVARALDVLGERWTLLVVRELLLGPKRFKELNARLPAMGTNRLSDRLKALSAQGVVARRTLPSPTDVAVYELTPLGEGLRPIILELALWGNRLPSDERVDPETARAELIALAVAAQSSHAASAGLHESYEFQVHEEHFHIAVDDGDVRVCSGVSPREPAIRASCDVRTFAQLAMGKLSPSHALGSSRISIVGKPATLTRAFRVLTAH